MGTHLDSMLSCLPQLYRDGQLVMEVLSSPAVQLESMDEEALATADPARPIRYGVSYGWCCHPPGAS